MAQPDFTHAEVAFGTRVGLGRIGACYANIGHASIPDMRPGMAALGNLVKDIRASGHVPIHLRFPNGHGGLMLPLGFNLLLIDNLTYCTDNKGAIRPEFLDPTSEVYNEYRVGLCSPVSFFQKQPL